MRLSQLREAKNVTARDMSLSLGQSHNFINNIELGKNFPTMLNFFYICEYLGVSPEAFFQYQNQTPGELLQIVRNLEQLSPDELRNIACVISDLSER